MSLYQSIAVDQPSNGHDHHRLSSKRKFEDYAFAFDDYQEDSEECTLVPIRMRKDDHTHQGPHPITAVHHSSKAPASSSSAASVVDSRPSSSSDVASSSSAVCSSSRLQFFVRMISEGKTIVVQANLEDTVKSLHQRIQVMTGIPVIEQRLIYGGKQLQWEQSLADCAIQNDAGLQLVGRMRSTDHPQTWQVMDDMISIICRLCRGEIVPSSTKRIKDCLINFFTITPKDNNDSAPAHLQIFMASSAPAALVMLYMSPINSNKQCADASIRQFLTSCRSALSKHLHSYCAPIILEFCKLLRKTVDEDNLYESCRSALGVLLGSFGTFRGLMLPEVKGLIALQDIFPFVSELADKLSRDLQSSVHSVGGPLLSDVRDFTAFLNPLRSTILEQVGYRIPISVVWQKEDRSNPSYGEAIEFLHAIFSDLLAKMERCLIRVGESLDSGGSSVGDLHTEGWSQYLAILKELNGISKLYVGAEEQFWMVLRNSKSSLCALIIRFGKRNDDNRWLLERKDVTDFESRRHLAMMMFPDVKEDYEELHEMLIDRSQLLSESFEYIARTDPESLHAGLFMEFKNEEATGPGVLREWFFLVCQAIFNPENALFVPCSNDRRRFFPNPASKVDPMHLEYFRFAGRVIALALMHKVQVGVVFDRVFIQQLAGMHISLEDIREADPFLYSSCKKILEMDAEFIDSDVLGLTFVREVEELGSRRIVELCGDGKNIVVNSRNRQEYVNLLIQDRFVTSISEQVEQFSQGFGHILSNSKFQKFFFQSLEPEDLDWMLYGSESPICFEDWKAHTEYNGYSENDPQITWFWEIVREMSAEKRKILLFFWTSLKHLPVEGFRGLASQLYIYKSSEPHGRLPSSHTCFYRLCFPPYPSKVEMQKRLDVITQEHVGCSFGTW
ncbi:E3 ubiquitin-protein ligase UPL5 [Hibiscus syriacus]|uniref:HECT-type E3 ubiquitin transferase n=1 Tax=Hibiscus syriacus TaxID=106335 RepID=A0A6A3CJA0_HIBSY|nr:E3 ubiquitin-protein ligase UPL5-like [Hibiscus syriacus]KAE8728856.1 E3 ubiquitin-protein ligase UPL5 [Hibiscus syriacus]